MVFTKSAKADSVPINGLPTIPEVENPMEKQSSTSLENQITMTGEDTLPDTVEKWNKVRWHIMTVMVTSWGIVDAFSVWFGFIPEEILYTDLPSHSSSHKIILWKMMFLSRKINLASDEWIITKRRRDRNARSILCRNCLLTTFNYLEWVHQMHLRLVYFPTEQTNQFTEMMSFSRTQQNQLPAATTSAAGNTLLMKNNTISLLHRLFAKPWQQNCHRRLPVSYHLTWRITFENRREIGCWTVSFLQLRSFRNDHLYLDNLMLTKEGCPIRFNGLPVSDERCGQFGWSGVGFGSNFLLV